MRCLMCNAEVVFIGAVPADDCCSASCLVFERLDGFQEEARRGRRDRTLPRPLVGW